MGYVDHIVQQSLALAETKGVAQYVEKARSVKGVDQVVDLVKAHGPQLVETIDRKVAETLDNVNDRKTKVFDQVHETKSKVYETVDEKKTLVLDIVNGKKTLVLETVDEKKAQVLEQVNDKKAKVFQKLDVAQQKKDEYVKLAYDVVQEKKDCALVTASEKTAFVVKRATSCIDEAAEKKAELMKTLLTRTEGTQFAGAAQYFVLMTDVALVKGDNFVRTGLRLPQTLKERMEGRSIEQAREYVFDFGREKIYRPLSLHTGTVAMFIVNGKEQFTAFAAERLLTSREFLLSNVKCSARFAKQQYVELMQNPRMAQMLVTVVLFGKHAAQAQAQGLVLKEQAVVKAAEARKLFSEKYDAMVVVLGEKRQVVLVFVEKFQADVAGNTALVKEYATLAVENASAKVVGLKASFKAHTD